MKPNSDLKREIKNFIKDSLKELEPDFIDTLDYGTFEYSAHKLGVTLFDLLNDEIREFIDKNNFENIHDKEDIETTVDNLMFYFIDRLTSGFEK